MSVLAEWNVVSDERMGLSAVCRGQLSYSCTLTECTPFYIA